MLTQTEFEGGVFHPSIDGGRIGARIEIAATELVARAIDGQVFRLPFSQMRLEEGGASGRMIFCRNPDRTLTIFCEHRQFLPALADFSGGVLTEQLERLRSDRFANRRGCLLSAISTLCILTGVLVGAYWLFFWLVAAAVSALPTEVDQEIGEAALPSVERFGDEIDERAIAQPAEAIVSRLAPHAPLQFPFSVSVLDSLEENALALPGGRLFVWRGMLEEAQSPEELAGVLAHEMAHVTQRHSLHRIGRSIGFVVGFQLLIGDFAGLVALAAELHNHTAMASFSREQELEADLVACDILYAAGIDPLAVTKLAERIHGRQGGRVPDWFDDHPDFPTRIAAIKARVATFPPKQFVPLTVEWDEMKRALAAFDARAANPPRADAAEEKPADEKPADVEAPAENAAPDATPEPNPEAKPDAAGDAR